MWGCTSTVKNAISSVLSGLVSSFRRILVVLMWFTVPLINTERLEYILLCTTITLDEVPKKITAVVEPSKIAGISEYMISHATSSLRLYTFKAGCGDLKAFFNIVPVGSRAYWVVCANVFWIMLAEIHPKKGCKRWKSGERLTVVLGVTTCVDGGGFCYRVLLSVIKDSTLM
jgi:hypothetical protein